MQCWRHGQCDGIVISVLHDTSSSNCLAACQDDQSCQWFNYNMRDKSCILMEDCQAFVAAAARSANTYLAGERQCSERLTKIMVIGGYDNSEGHPTMMSSVEVIDLEDQDNICQAVADYPLLGGGQVASVVDGVVKVCGSNHKTDECYEYDRAEDSWSLSSGMTTQRKSAKSSLIDGVWLVSGDADSAVSTFSTEYFDGDDFVKGPTAPVVLQNHCQITLNSTHVFFSNDIDLRSYVLKWDEDKTFEQLPGYLNRLRLYPSCGKAGDNEVVIVGSDLMHRGTSEIYNFQDQEWRRGPEMEVALNQAGYAQFGDTFVVLGGFDEEMEVRDEIYFFDHVNYEWKQMGQKLKVPRAGYPAVVPVPDDMVTCSKSQ